MSDGSLMLEDLFRDWTIAFFVKAPNKEAACVELRGIAQSLAMTRKYFKVSRGPSGRGAGKCDRETSFPSFTTL